MFSIMDTENQKSKIRLIGIALFGESWMSQLARNISKISGIKVTRHTVASWDRDDRVPQWVYPRIKEITKIRHSEITLLHAELSKNN